MQVLRRRDQNEIKIFLLEHQPMIDERSHIGRNRFCSFPLGCVDVTNSGEVRVRTAQSVTHDLLAARSEADYSELKPVVRTDNSSRNGQAADSSGNLPKKSAARAHETCRNVNTGSRDEGNERLTADAFLQGRFQLCLRPPRTPEELRASLGPNQP